MGILSRWQFTYELWINNVGGHHTGGIAQRSTGRDALKRYCQRVACFGTFNIDTEDAEARLPEILSRIFELSSIAGHISLLTDYYPGDLAPHIRSWSPHRVYELAMEVTPYVVLRHDYLPQDFSVTLYHEPLIDRRKRET